MFDLFSSGYGNYFSAECFNGSSWQSLFYWDDSYGAASVTTVTVSMSACVGTASAQIRFRAYGYDTWGINGWHVNGPYVY
jgi:hypothetical protein